MPKLLQVDGSFVRSSSNKCGDPADVKSPRKIYPSDIPLESTWWVFFSMNKREFLDVLSPRKMEATGQRRIEMSCPNNAIYTMSWPLRIGIPLSTQESKLPREVLSHFRGDHPKKVQKERKNRNMYSKTCFFQAPKSKSPCSHPSHQNWCLLEGSDLLTDLRSRLRGDGTQVLSGGSGGPETEPRGEYDVRSLHDYDKSRGCHTLFIRKKVHTIPIGSMVLLYMVTWIPSIYPQC